MADFEASGAISEWDFDPEAWQIVNEGGQNILIGRASLSQPMVILGRGTPEWLDSTASDFVVSFNFNLDPETGGARLVFRYQEGIGYNVVEVFPGLLFLKRNAPGAPNIFDRNTERLIRQNAQAPIRSNTWHNLTIWVEGSRIFIYLDRELALRAEDLITPQLGAGQLILQTNNTFRATRFDDFIIQRAEPFSDHFQAAGIPGTWQTTNTTNTVIQTESDGNQFVRMANEAEFEAQGSPVQDFTLRARIWSENGGYQLYVRESAGGAMLFDFDAGNLTVSHLDGSGATVNTYPVPNFYTRGQWQDMDITMVGDRLEIYLDGRSRFEDTLPTSPGAGGVRFVTARNDIVRIDDVLFTQTATTATSGAAFAFQLQAEVLARDFRWLRSDVDEHFENVFQTQDWWLGGVNATGEFLNDPAASDHQSFLRMTYLERPTWRLFRDIVGVEMFGAGQNRNFSDSTDLYVTVDIRFPDGGSGTAWLGIRVTQSISGAELEGYRFEVRRNPDGSTDFIVRYVSATQREVLFEGPIPGFDEEMPEWISLTAISYRDQLAFFANGRFLFALDNAARLGGTVALGVEENTTADFDTLIIRDTTPHGGQ